MERLGDKLDQVKLDRSSQARFAPYQQLHLGACLGEAAFLVVRLPIRLTGLQARRTEPSHPEPPHCREAAQRASENSFALLEGTQKIALITPGSVTARKHVQCTKSQDCSQACHAIMSKIAWQQQPLRLNPAAQARASSPHKLSVFSGN
ncbi:hypothetical protein WJX77_010734 [Trebouxia sp. C0004]